jgi:drug/metabolite transporter (DMT)-like permease
VIFIEVAKFIPSAEAGPVALLDVVLGPIWVFIAFGEDPGLATILGGAIVLAAATWRRNSGGTRFGGVEEEKWTGSVSPW